MSDGAHDAMSLIVNILLSVMMIVGFICRDTCVVAFTGFTLVILAIESIGRELREARRRCLREVPQRSGR